MNTNKEFNSNKIKILDPKIMQKGDIILTRHNTFQSALIRGAQKVKKKKSNLNLDFLMC